MVEQNSASSAAPARPFQFTLKQLLAAFFVVCTFFGAYSALGVAGMSLWIVAAGLMGVLIGLLRGRVEIIVGSILGTIVLWCLLGGLFDSRGPSPRSTCMFNIREVGIAVQQYRLSKGSFPQAYIADENGKPIHSWRTSILPIIGQQQLNDEYDWSEPWNGLNNRKLANITIPHFLCPSDHQSQTSGMTSYVLLTGPGTAWPDGKNSNWNAVAQRAGNTIMLVEVSGANIRWMEPRDLDIMTLKANLRSKHGLGVSHNHQGGTVVCMADGKVVFLTDSQFAEFIDDMLAAAEENTSP